MAAPVGSGQACRLLLLEGEVYFRSALGIDADSYRHF
jgi:hypothetical protein